MFTVPILLIIMAAVAGSAGMAGFAGWILHRLSRLENTGPARLERLIADTEALREQIDAMRASLRALDERVEFTEQLLEKRRPDPALPPGPEAD